MKRIYYIVDIYILDTETKFTSTESTWSQMRDTLENWEWLSNKFGILYEATLDKVLEEVPDDA